MVALCRVRAMDIRPASLDQVIEARDGRKVVIDRDVGDVARQLREIHQSLVLRWHEGPNRRDLGHYSVIQVTEEGTEHLVATCLPIPGGSPDPGLVEKVRQVASSGYNVADEMERREREHVRSVEHARREQAGPELERAYSRFLKATGGNQRRIFVP